MDYFNRVDSRHGPGGVKCRCCNEFHPEITKHGNQIRRRKTRRRLRQSDTKLFRESV